MKVLVTGHLGFIGGYVERELVAHGHSTRGLDRKSGTDINNPRALDDSLRGCDAVVHLAALPHDTAGTPEQIFETNLLGTWRLLLAAQRAGVRKFVHVSSAQVFGLAEGERAPDYLPIDDAHPTRASRPYGLSKRLAEEACQAVTEQTGLTTICLRPFKVRRPDSYQKLQEKWRRDPKSEWTPFWDLGTLIDVRDVASAARLAIETAFEGHIRASLVADSIAASRPSLEMAAALLPGVPIRDRERYRLDPRASLVDARIAKEILNWQPEHTWPPSAV